MHYENHVQKDASPMNGPKELTVQTAGVFQDDASAHFVSKCICLWSCLWPHVSLALGALVGQEMLDYWGGSSSAVSISAGMSIRLQRLGTDDAYTTACRVTESVVMLWAERGGNVDSLGVLDLREKW